MIVLRILLFILLAIVLGLIGSGMAGGIGPSEHNYGGFGLVAGVVIAWFASGVPFRKRDAKFRSPLDLTFR